MLLQLFYDFGFQDGPVTGVENLHASGDCCLDEWLGPNIRPDGLELFGGPCTCLVSFVFVKELEIVILQAQFVEALL